MSREIIRRFLPLWPWVVAALCVLGYGCEQRRAGAFGERLNTLTAEYAALQKQHQLVRTQFVRDTVVLTKRVTTYERLRDSVFATDTVLAHDTTFIRVTQTADTAIRACREVVTSCVINLRIADSMHVVDQRMIHALRSAQPSVVRRWSERLLWASAGYAVSSVLHR